jgi:hypothetical protein
VNVYVAWAAQALGTSVTAAHTLRGPEGPWRLVLADGSQVVLKVDGFVPTEAEALRFATENALKVPRVLAVQGNRLLRSLVPGTTDPEGAGFREAARGRGCRLGRSPRRAATDRGAPAADATHADPQSAAPRRVARSGGGGVP